MPQLDATWAAVIPTTATIIGIPVSAANFTLDGDSDDAITIKTDQDSITLDHTCIYGKRVDKVESELRNQITPKSP